jgi:hypothetical protein
LSLKLGYEDRDQRRTYNAHACELGTKAECLLLKDDLEDIFLHSRPGNLVRFFEQDIIGRFASDVRRINFVQKRVLQVTG